MYACMYVYMYVCMYVCLHVCMFACMYVCMYVSFHLPTYLPVCQSISQSINHSIIHSSVHSILFISANLSVRVLCSVEWSQPVYARYTVHTSQSRCVRSNAGLATRDTDRPLTYPKLTSPLKPCGVADRAGYVSVISGGAHQCVLIFCNTTVQVADVFNASLLD